MKAKKIWANYSVKDVKRTSEFYSALGFKPNGTNNYPQLASFLFGENDFIIHFFEQGSQIDEYLTPGSNASNEIIFSLSTDTEGEVQEWAEKVKNAGGTILIKPGRDANNYYTFAFEDPDGHRFNVLLLEKGM